MKRKPRSGFIWLLWVVAGFAVEMVTLFDDVPNNTLSHWVSYAVTEHPWIGVALPVISVVTLGHWVLKKWIWPQPTWEEDEPEN